MINNSTASAKSIGDFHHVSVMPEEVMQALAIKPNGIYVDATLGGGGHSAKILECLPTGRLIGIDRDKSAIKAATERLQEQKKFLPFYGNFHDLPDILSKLGLYKVDGVLIDLGISSHQIDTPERGFSFRFDGPLDMRMDKHMKLTAEEIVNSYDEKKLMQILFEYGEEKNSKKVARAICKARAEKPISTTLELSKIIERCFPPYFGNRLHPATRSFMALRIAVNDELSPLEGVIRGLVPFLTQGGRIVIITFHSLEDRIVKKTFASLANPCDCPRDIPYCVCGKKPELNVISRKPILPGSQELTANKRASSAKLRVAERR